MQSRGSCKASFRSSSCCRTASGRTSSTESPARAGFSALAGVRHPWSLVAKATVGRIGYKWSQMSFGEISGEILMILVRFQIHSKMRISFIGRQIVHPIGKERAAISKDYYDHVVYWRFRQFWQWGRAYLDRTKWVHLSGDFIWRDEREWLVISYES